MNPTRVFAENYRTYAQLDVELPEGCTAIIGPNGAGKSSIVNLIELALFGPRNRQLAQLLQEGSEQPLVVGCEFEHRDDFFRARRTYSPAGRGKSTLDFEQLHVGSHALGGGDENWLPLTRGSMTETQELIEATLDLSRDTFKASAFLAQGDGAAFTEALPAKRKEMLGEVLGLDVWDRLRDRAAARLRIVDEEVKRLAVLLERAKLDADQAAHVRSQIQTSRDELRVQTEAVVDLEAQLEQARDDYRIASEHSARLEAARATLRTAETELDRLAQLAEAARDAAAEMEKLQGPLAEAERAAGQLAELEAALDAEKARIDEHRVKRMEYEAALAARRDHQHRLEAERAAALALAARIATLARAEVAHCETCGQELGADERVKVRDSLTAQLAVHEQRVAELEEGEPAEPAEPGAPPSSDSVDDLAERIGAARMGARDVAILTERRRHLQLRADQVPEPGSVDLAEQQVIDAGAKVTELAAQTVDLAAAKQRGAELSLKAKTARATAETEAANVARLELRLEQCEQAERDVDEHVKADYELATRRLTLELAVKAYSRDGVPALIVESVAVPQIETEANRILAELGTSYTVELRTQKETAAGTITESLDIVIATPTGERLYETYSGGERTRINLALRIALARLLAHRRGAEVRMLAIDEPEFLDDDGVEQLALVLQGLSTDFDRILLISHMPALKDAFHQAIVVRRDGERSATEFAE